MKKLLLLFGLLIATTSCEDTNTSVVAEDGTEYKIEVIDSCEYIYKYVGKKGFMAHKGNCSNPIHKN